MNNDDDELLTLRDKLAIELLNALIIADSNKNFPNIEEFLKHFDHADGEEKKYGNRMAERMVRAAYKMADIMRKVRLSTFE